MSKFFRLVVSGLVIGAALGYLNSPSLAQTEQVRQKAEVDFSVDGILNTVIESGLHIWKGFLEHIPLLIAAMILLIVTWLLAKGARLIAKRLFGRTHMRESLRELLTRFIGLTIWAVGLLASATVLFPGMTPAKALGALGIASIAVGLAFQDIFENFFAGILLLWNFPFENGDYIECEGVMGQVHDITVRNTLLRLPSGELDVVPNSFLFKNPVTILTDQTKRRVIIMAGVAYGEDVERSVGVIESAVKQCATVDTTHPIQIFPQAFGASSIDIEVAWWTDPKPVDIRRSRGEVVTAVKKALDEAGIEIPFPYRTLTFHEPIHAHLHSVNGADGAATTDA